LCRAAGCAKACNRNAECVGWVSVSDGSGCWLKSAQQLAAYREITERDSTHVMGLKPGCVSIDTVDTDVRLADEQARLHAKIVEERWATASGSPFSRPYMPALHTIVSYCVTAADSGDKDEVATWTRLKDEGWVVESLTRVMIAQMYPSPPSAAPACRTESHLLAIASRGQIL
jgi:hypothetical protein